MARSSGLTKPAPRSRPSRQSALANGTKSYRAASPTPPPEASISVPANPDDPSDSGAGPNDNNAFGTATGKRRDNNFLEKLWHFLDSSASTGIMGFSDNGHYLVMYDPEAVPAALSSANICKHKDYGSFQRQMCIYGWRRLAQSELPKLVLTEGEKPGETTNTLSGIKVMQHETLKRDSDMEDVRAVPRKAKPKASRAKNAEAARASSVASTSSSILPPTRPSQSLALGSKTKSARSARTKTAKPPKKSAYVESDDDEEIEGEDDFNGDPVADEVEAGVEDGGSDMELETMETDKEDPRMDDDGDITASQSSMAEHEAIIIPADQLTAPLPIQLDMPHPPPPLAPGAMSIPIPGAQNTEMADGTTYASLPKSLQEAFLILDNLTPTPTLEHSQDDAEMIDPSLVADFDTAHTTLPPLPPASSTSSLSNSKPVSTASSDGTDISTEATLTAAQRAYLAAAMQPPPTLPQPFYYQQESGPHFLQTETAALSLPGHFRLTSPHVHRDT